MKPALSILLIFLLAQSAPAESWGPWSTSPEAPVVSQPEDLNSGHRDHPELISQSISATPFLWLITFYQKTINRIINGRCHMYPTCSQYSVQAIRKHGPIIGIMMTADRIMHEGSEQELIPSIKVGNHDRFYDPVEYNDFWWYHK
ncbi:MAG TPA: membrane protein insertion efficiency factor YidD [Nitrospirota bacterium]|nr:membrane protein insertion efficiency factor YidD [Nitrospirota bacterium]